MKKIWFILVMVTSVLVMTGCGSSSNSSNSYSMDDFSLKNKDGRVIKYGMNREDVEKVLGEPTEEGSLGIQYHDMRIIYRDDKAVSIYYDSTDDTEPIEAAWKTTKGITIGSSEEEFYKAYNTKNMLLSLKYQHMM